MTHDPLYVLLQRAIEDDGPEGAVAFNIFKRRAKGKTGTLLFIDEEDHASQPLLYVLKDEQAKIERLKKELATIRLHMKNAISAIDRAEQLEVAA